jgi:RNA polymerase sigma factor for flagellar operon FliA
MRSAGYLESERELGQLAMRIPPRTKERHVPVEDVALAAPNDFDRIATHRERERLEVAVREALTGLSPEDLTITRMRFWDDISVADIARTLRLEQKPLYRRLESIQARIRKALESKGIDREVARDVLMEVVIW